MCNTDTEVNSIHSLFQGGAINKLKTYPKKRHLMLVSYEKLFKKKSRKVSLIRDLEAYTITTYKTPNGSYRDELDLGNKVQCMNTTKSCISQHSGKHRATLFTKQ